MSMHEGTSLLIVEDDGPLRERLSRAFDARGLDVRAASTTDEAARLAREDPPELVLLDLRVGTDSGLDRTSKSLRAGAGRSGFRARTSRRGTDRGAGVEAAARMERPRAGGSRLPAPSGSGGLHSAMSASASARLTGSARSRSSRRRTRGFPSSWK